MSYRTRPLVGLNVDVFTPAKSGIPMLRLPLGYIDAIVTAGGLPLVIPPFTAEKELDTVLERLDGIVLVGGNNDVDPRRYGQPPHPQVVPMADRRDVADRWLIQRVLDRQLPVLAVGLGMQQLNVACGGTLYAHLPQDLPRAMPHRDTAEAGPHRHAVQIEANTRLEEIYGGGELIVCSTHHQAIRTVASNFRMAARAPDDVIEAIESTHPNWFCVGVQWHPEASAASALDMQLFEGFIQACIRQQHPMAMVG